jgi:hypothetical protein
METKVLTQEELQSLKNIQSKRDQITINLGYIEYQIQELELQKESLVEGILSLKNEEAQISKEIQSKYGKINVNMDNGEFIVLD